MRRDKFALALLCAGVLTILGSASAHAQGNPGVSGTFSGSYQCAQGWSDVTLTVLPGAQTARFAFAGHGVDGAYIVSIVPLGNGSYDLRPLRWERAPANYGMVGARVSIQGDSLSGRIANPGCGAIRARRADGAANPWVEPVPGASPTQRAPERTVADRRSPADGGFSARRPIEPADADFAALPRVAIFLSCRAATSSDATASLARYRADLTAKAEQTGKLLSSMRDPDALRRDIEDAKRAIALTPYEQQQLDVANGEVQRLMARGAFMLAARVKERNDRVLAQIFGTAPRRAAQQRLQDAEAQLAAQAGMAGQVRAALQDYDQARTNYEGAIRATISQPASIAALTDYLALENDIALLASCRSSAGAQSGDVTFQALAAQAGGIVPELNKRVSDAIAAGTNSSLLGRSLARYRVSRALRLNPASAAVIARADTTLAAMQQKEARARELAEAKANAAKRAAAEAAARAYATSDHGRLSNAVAEAYFRAPSWAVARGLGAATINQNVIDAILAKYIFTTRAESCSKTAKGTVCTYELQLTLSTIFDVSSPWVKRTDTFFNEGGALRSAALDQAMAAAAATSNSGGSTSTYEADEKAKWKEQDKLRCQSMFIGRAFAGDAVPLAMC